MKSSMIVASSAAILTSVVGVSTLSLAAKPGQNTNILLIGHFFSAKSLILAAGEAQAVPSSATSEFKPASSFPMEAPTTPATNSSVIRPVGGAALPPTDEAKKSATTFVTCGSRSAGFIISSADSVPVGCHSANTTQTPSAASKKSK